MLHTKYTRMNQIKNIALSISFTTVWTVFMMAMAIYFM